MNDVIHRGSSAGRTKSQDEMPLPQRIARTLMARIFVGELKPDNRFPPDRVLAQQFGVERTSLCSALNELMLTLNSINIG